MKICSFNLPGVLLLREGNAVIWQDLPYPEACWPWCSGLISFEFSVNKSFLRTGNSICSSPLSQQRGASRHQPANICHQFLSQILKKQMLGASPLWTLDMARRWMHFRTEDHCRRQKSLLFLKGYLCATLIGGLRNAINYFKIITRATWNTQTKKARLKTDSNLWNEATAFGNSNTGHVLNLPMEC